MTLRFDIIETPLVGLSVIQRKFITDERGYFQRLYCAEELKLVLGHGGIVQINHSQTDGRGTVRGMHYQHPPHAEAKIMTCVKGEVFDVAVDIRHDSPTFLNWHSEIISAENKKSLLVPAGFAHGYQAMTDDTEMLYFNTALYHPAAEGGIRPNDPRVAIDWPLPVVGLSERDAAHPLLAGNFFGVMG